MQINYNVLTDTHAFIHFEVVKAFAFYTIYTYSVRWWLAMETQFWNVDASAILTLWVGDHLSTCWTVLIHLIHIEHMWEVRSGDGNMWDITRSLYGSVEQTHQISYHYHYRNTHMQSCRYAWFCRRASTMRYVSITFSA